MASGASIPQRLLTTELENLAKPLVCIPIRPLNPPLFLGNSHPQPQ